MARATLLFATTMTTTAFTRAPSLASMAARRAMVAGGATTSSVEEMSKAADVVVFSKSYCPFCAQTKSLFASLGVDADVIELDLRDDGADLQDALKDLTGQSTVPNVFIKGQHLGPARRRRGLAGRPQGPHGPVDRAQRLHQGTAPRYADDESSSRKKRRAPPQQNTTSAPSPTLVSQAERRHAESERVGQARRDARGVTRRAP
eukprot:CAMPEP_0185720190 /NCGR_PEP_ID=MMETSP1164-20130828/49991_1 /TAXON_ID=1104430 /ORGANISM="Chrysoreinhardia sp, Strain CCMP2950" /LENGTH=203 /DNA_ID=CAMNT_0028387853 /DNA_START=80 /DNA_END=692 /DNA_ORIENTATION=-